MAETLKPMTDSDVTADAGARAAPPLKGGTIDGAKQSLKDNSVRLREQAGDKARTYAENGKTKATGALAQLSEMLTEAAANVDEKFGAQYGQYARTAADKVQGFSSTLDDKTVDELMDNAREFVRKSPAVAIGAAAALGFVVARLLASGLDQRDEA